MLVVERVLGRAGEPAMAERLHALAHAGAVEYLRLEPGDTARRRLRATTDHGTEVGIALPRDQALANGAVLLLEPGRAIVVRVREDRWLTLRPAEAAAALELGYHAGNLHWRVRFGEGALAGCLQVALEAPEADYLARLEPLLAGGRVSWSLEAAG